MRQTRAVLGVFLAATATAVTAQPPAAPDPFQGLWAVDAITNNGKALPDDMARRLVLVVKGKERFVKDGDDVVSHATFAADVAKKTIDVTVAEGPLAGKTLRGIFAFDGDTLRVCLSLDGDARPDDLTAPAGSKRLLQVYTKSGGKTGPAVKNPDLRTELLARKAADQGDRQRILAVLKEQKGMPDDHGKGAIAVLSERQAETDEKNAAWLRAVVGKHGWPGFAAVGKDGAEAAFLLAQHADADRALQAKCLTALTAAVAAKDAEPAHLAYLTDRVRVGGKKAQVYGTELEEKDGALVPAPIEDEPGVDARRKAVGLPPLADALAQARRDRGLPEKQ